MNLSNVNVNVNVKPNTKKMNMSNIYGPIIIILTVILFIAFLTLSIIFENPFFIMFTVFLGLVLLNGLLLISPYIIDIIKNIFKFK